MKTKRSWLLGVVIVAVTLQSCNSTRLSSYSTEDELYGGRSTSSSRFSEPEPLSFGTEDPSSSYEMPVTGGSDMYSDDYFENTESTFGPDEEAFADNSGDTYITNNYYGDDEFYYASRIRRFQQGYGGSYYDSYYTDPYWYTLDAIYLTSAIYSYSTWGRGPSWRFGWGSRMGFHAGWTWGSYYPSYGYAGYYNPWRPYYGSGWGYPYGGYASYGGGCYPYGGGYAWSGGSGYGSGSGSRPRGHLNGYSYNPSKNPSVPGRSTRVSSSGATSTTIGARSNNIGIATNHAGAINAHQNQTNRGTSGGTISSSNPSKISHGTSTSNGIKRPETVGRHTTRERAGYNYSGAKAASDVRTTPRASNTTHTTRSRSTTSYGNWSSGSTRNTVKHNTTKAKPVQKTTRTYNSPRTQNYNSTRTFTPAKQKPTRNYSRPSKSNNVVKPKTNFNRTVAPQRTRSVPKAPASRGNVRSNPVRSSSARPMQRRTR